MGKTWPDVRPVSPWPQPYEPSSSPRSCPTSPPSPPWSWPSRPPPVHPSWPWPPLLWLAVQKGLRPALLYVRGKYEDFQDYLNLAPHPLPFFHRGLRLRQKSIALPCSPSSHRWQRDELPLLRAAHQEVRRGCTAVRPTCHDLDNTAFESKARWVITKNHLKMIVIIDKVLYLGPGLRAGVRTMSMRRPPGVTACLFTILSIW